MLSRSLSTNRANTTTTTGYNETSAELSPSGPEREQNIRDDVEDAGQHDHAEHRAGAA
jgi:hypothetical protein